MLREARRIVPTVTLTSPINGTVTVRHVSPGERVEPAAPVFTIADLEPLWVNIQVPAARLANISVGALVTLPAQGAQGKIIRIGRTVDPNTQSTIAVAEIDSNNGAVRPGPGCHGLDSRVGRRCERMVGAAGSCCASSRPLVDLRAYQGRLSGTPGANHFGNAARRFHPRQF